MYLTVNAGIHARGQCSQHWKSIHTRTMHPSLIMRPEATTAFTGASQDRLAEVPVASNLQSSVEHKQHMRRGLEIISNCDAVELACFGGCTPVEPADCAMHPLNKSRGKKCLKPSLRPFSGSGGSNTRRSRFFSHCDLHIYSLSYVLFFLFMVGASSAFFAANRPQAAYSFSSCHWYCSPSQCIDDCNVGGYPVIKLNSRYGWLPLVSFFLHLIF
jgi:hypothetical protein